MEARRQSSRHCVIRVFGAINSAAGVVNAPTLMGQARGQLMHKRNRIVDVFDHPTGINQVKLATSRA